MSDLTVLKAGLRGLSPHLPTPAQRLDQGHCGGLPVGHGLHPRAARVQCGGLRPHTPLVRCLDRPVQVFDVFQTDRQDHQRIGQSRLLALRGRDGGVRPVSFQISGPVLA